MTDKLIEAVARAMEKFFSGADIAYGEHVEAARAALKAIDDSGTHAMTQWQPIDTAPKDGTWVLLLWPISSRRGPVACEGQFYHAKDGDSFWWSMLKLDTEPTHWMPLPSPPDREGK